MYTITDSHAAVRLPCLHLRASSVARDSGQIGFLATFNTGNCRRPFLFKFWNSSTFAAGTYIHVWHCFYTYAGFVIGLRSCLLASRHVCLLLLMTVYDLLVTADQSVCQYSLPGVELALSRRGVLPLHHIMLISKKNRREVYKYLFKGIFRSLSFVLCLSLACSVASLRQLSKVSQPSPTRSCGLQRVFFRQRRTSTWPATLRLKASPTCRYSQYDSAVMCTSAVSHFVGAL